MSESISEARITVIYENQDVTLLVKSVECTGHSNTPSRDLSLTLKNTINGRTQAITFEKGKSIEFFNNGKSILTGIIFSTNINEKGELTLKAYDENIYLLKSTESRLFTNMKASDIANRLCADFGVPVGQIEDTGYVIPKLTIRGKSLYDIIILALTLTKKQTGRRFFISIVNGKFTLFPFTENTTKWVIESGVNLLNASYSESIEETKTRVKVIGGKDDSITVVKSDGNLEKLYGIMQVVETMDGDATQSQVDQRATELLKERGVIDDQAQVKALGLDDVVTGTSIYAIDPMTGIIGGYFVTSDSHTYANGLHTMDVELSATYELPELEASEEELGGE